MDSKSMQFLATVFLVFALMIIFLIVSSPYANPVIRIIAASIGGTALIATGIIYYVFKRRR